MLSSWLYALKATRDQKRDSQHISLKRGDRRSSAQQEPYCPYDNQNSHVVQPNKYKQKTEVEC